MLHSEYLIIYIINSSIMITVRIFNTNTKYICSLEKKNMKEENS